jgi:hypothetical protein
MRFKVGDRVRWQSQAAGVLRVKVGQVVEVVPPCREPQSRGDFGMPRDHESYVVRAIAVGRATKQARCYWPRASALALDDSEAEAS